MERESLVAIDPFFFPLHHPIQTMPLPDSATTALIAKDFFAGFKDDDGVVVLRPDSSDLAKRHNVKTVQINMLMKEGNWIATRKKRELQLMGEGAGLKEECIHFLQGIRDSVEQLMAQGRIMPTVADGLRAAKLQLEAEGATESEGVSVYREIHIQMQKFAKKVS